MKRGGNAKKTTGLSSFLSGLKRVNAGWLSEGGGRLTKEIFTLLPLHELVLYPHTVVPIFITAHDGIAAVDEALRRDNRLFAACLKKRDQTYPEGEEPWPVGTVVRVIQHLRLPDNTYRVVLQGEYRGRIIGIEQRVDYSLVKIEPIDSGFFSNPPLPEDVALMRAVQRSFAQYAELSKKIGSETLLAVERTESPERLANLICNSMQLKPEKKIELLAISGAAERLVAILETLERENEIYGIQKNISGKVRSRMEKHQREYYLHEQLKEITKNWARIK